MPYFSTNNDEEERRSSSWRQKAKKFCFRRLPITQFCRKYSKVDMLSDIIAGVTIALTMIPQSIAYASLAGLNPQFGLNSTFMGGFIYAIFGTIKEVSIGPTSLLSLLTFEYTRDLNSDFVLLLTFISGVVEFLMGLLKLGFLINFISAPVTSGFTTATSIIVVVSQLKGILGVRFKSCGFLDNIFELIMHASETKLTGDFALGIFCIIFLLVLRNLKDINIDVNTSRKRTLKKTLWFISTGRNAIIVLICICIASWFERNNIKPPFILSGTSESGVPPFKIPPLTTKMGNTTFTAIQMVEELGSGVVIVPIVAVLANIAIAKAFSTTKTIDATQEMLALSLCNILGSCFGSMPTCGAFTRSAVSNASGVRSPIAGVFSGFLCLLALNFLSPHFHLIPRATLSAILICAVVFLIDWQIIVPLWKTNKKELFVLVLTLITCLCFGVEIGLLIGVICNLSKLLYLWGEPEIKQEQLKCSSGEYILLTPDKGLFFPAVDKLHSTVIKVQDKSKRCLPVAIDCIHFSGIDYTAVKALVNMANQSEENNCTLIFLNIDQSFISTCWKIGCGNMLFCHNQEDLNNILLGKSKNTPKSVALTLSKEKEDNYSNRNQSKNHEIIALLEQNR